MAAATIEAAGQLATLDALLAQDGPLLIDIQVDPQQEFTPRIKSRVDENGKFLTPALDDMFPFLDPQIVQQVRQSALSLTMTPDAKEQ